VVVAAAAAAGNHCSGSCFLLWAGRKSGPQSFSGLACRERP